MNTLLLKTLIFLPIMDIINVIRSVFLIASVYGFVLNYDDEDRILDMLLSDNHIPYQPNESEEVLRDREQKPVLVNGVWLCGNCSDISEANLLYNESYDMEIAYDDEIELQVGFALDNMRCIKIHGDEDAEVERVNGACAGDAVTLKVINTNNCDIWIYS